MTAQNTVFYDAKGPMLSIPHLIVIFVVVLVVFGPQKLPELARGLGKLMAELRKASSDFRYAFEEEMRDLDRQSQETERKRKESAALPSPAPEERALAAEQPGSTAAVPGTEPGDAPSASASEEPAAASSAAESSAEKTIHGDRQPV